MCLILLAKGVHPRYQLILATNRDEYYDRPTRQLDYWEEAPGVLAGRDLEGGGTWLGITRSGRLAAITNYRDLSSVKTAAPSRGELVSGYLDGIDSPDGYLARVRQAGHRYNGFNLLTAGPGGDVYYYSNRRSRVEAVPDGVHGLSNAFLNTPWPKVAVGVRGMAPLVSADPPDIDAFLALLNNRVCPPDHELPETGVGLAWERLLAPLFISSEIYGTRSSSVILITRDGVVSFLERTYYRPQTSGKPLTTTRRFEFQIDGSAGVPSAG
jgi:uncharacterized protein with NRDE domain